MTKTRKKTDKKDTDENQIVGGHPTLNRLSDNSISSQNNVNSKVSKAIK
jgi:hypothetical protein